MEDHLFQIYMSTRAVFGKVILIISLLEIGFSYGLPAAMIIFIFIIFLIFLSFKKIFLIKNFNLAQGKDFYTKSFLGFNIYIIYYSAN